MLPPKIRRTAKARAANEVKPLGLGSDAYFRMLVDSISDYAMITLDLDGNVATWNKGAERIKG